MIKVIKAYMTISCSVRSNYEKMTCVCMFGIPPRGSFQTKGRCWSYKHNMHKHICMHAHIGTHSYANSVRTDGFEGMLLSVCGKLKFEGIPLTALSQTLYLTTCGASIDSWVKVHELIVA